MKKLLMQYASYNLWANQLITGCINNLSDDQINKEFKSSFPTIFSTLGHLWDAESIWWQRIKLSDNVEWPFKTFSGSVLELGNNLFEQSKKWKEWVESASEKTLEHEFLYRNSKRDRFKQPVHEMLMHLFNHQTYHRGQLVTLLRGVESEKVPNTDLIAFLRKK